MSSPLRDPLLRPPAVESDEDAEAFPPSPPTSSSLATLERSLFGGDVEAGEPEADPWGTSVARSAPSAPTPLPPPVEADFSPAPKPVAGGASLRGQKGYSQLDEDGDPLNQEQAPEAGVEEDEAVAPKVLLAGNGCVPY